MFFGLFKFFNKEILQFFDDRAGETNLGKFAFEKRNIFVDILRITVTFFHKWITLKVLTYDSCMHFDIRIFCPVIKASGFQSIKLHNRYPELQKPGYYCNLTHMGGGKNVMHVTRQLFSVLHLLSEVSWVILACKCPTNFGENSYDFLVTFYVSIWHLVNILKW